MQILGVTRPEPLNTFSDIAAPMDQPMMAKAFRRAESVSPVEGDEKSITATVQIKVRF